MPAIKIRSIKPTDDSQPGVRLTFVAAFDEAEYRDPSYQRELQAIVQTLKVQGIKVQPRATFQKSGTGGSWLTGDFLVHLSALGTPAGALFGSWITAKLGRKVRIKVGDIEIEAANIEQVEQLLERAREIKSENDKQP